MGRLRGVKAGGSKGRRGTRSILERLSGEEAQGVLHRLLAAHPELGREAETIALSHLGEVSFEAVADEVEESVLALAIDDLNGRAGDHEFDYVEPSEAACEILDEAVEPFVVDIGRRIDLGLEADALEICKGALLGLYRVDHTKGNEVLDWAPDFPSDAAAEVLGTWLAGGGGRKGAVQGPRRNRPAFPMKFADRFVPEWRSMIAHLLSGKR